MTQFILYTRQSVGEGEISQAYGPTQDEAVANAAGAKLQAATPNLEYDVLPLEAMPS